MMGIIWDYDIMGLPVSSVPVGGLGCCGAIWGIITSHSRHPPGPPGIASIDAPAATRGVTAAVYWRAPHFYIVVFTMCSALSRVAGHLGPSTRAGGHHSGHVF